MFAAPALRFGFVGLHQLGRALRGLPSSSLVRSCDRPEILSCGSAFFRVLAESPCPPPRAPLLGFQPPRLRAFSAQRAGTFAARRRPARVVSSCVGRLATSPPEGLACRRRWALARHLSCALPSAAEVACVGAPESASPSEVASSFEAAIPFRGSWFVVVPPDKNDLTHVAIARQAPHRLSTVAGTSDCAEMSRGCRVSRKLQKFSPRPSTACGQRARHAAKTRTRAAAPAQSRVRRH